MRPRRKIRNQVIVVVGATSGVGRATVTAALDQGARVAAVATDAAALAELAVEAGRPHRLEPVLVGNAFSARRVAHATTARFGVLHTWVQVVGRSDVDALELSEAGTVALGQLRRSGGGTFVPVVSEPDGRRTTDSSARRRSRALAQVRAALGDRHELASVAAVVRTGVTAPREVSDAILRVAVRPRAEVVVHGPPRWLSVVAPVRPRAEVVARRIGHRPGSARRPAWNVLSLTK